MSPSQLCDVLRDKQAFRSVNQSVSKRTNVLYAFSAARTGGKSWWLTLILIGDTKYEGLICKADTSNTRFHFTCLRLHSISPLGRNFS